MPYKTTWKDRLENAEPFLGPIIAGTLILALVGWLAWHTYGPAKTAKPLGRTPQDEAARSAAVQRVASEADVLEKTYRRALEAGAAPDATARMLNRAIEKQTELLRLGSSSSPVQTEKLAGLEAERATQRARSALARSKLLEAESLAAQQAGLNVEAREKMREALRLQQEANANAAAPALRDAPRESRLAQEIEAADAGPLVAGVASGLTLARSAVARENWDEALKNFSEARKGQEEINRRFPGSRFADVKALEKIDGEIESVQAGSLVVATQAREREAETATKAGRAQEAGASLAAAAAAQRELNVKFPRSRFASTTRLEELEARRQTVLSEVKLGRAIAIERDIGAALRRRQNVAAAEKLAEAAKLVETVATDFPLSRALNPTLQRKLAYLAMRAGELDTLQEQVLGRLAAVPGTVGLQMLKTEVPQEFYERVMNLNPSRNVGRGLPVDSVSWVDAQEFCVRVSWLLGLRVRLPSEPEFAACWSGAGAGVWSAENSEGRSQESGKRTVSRMGFHDLAGNLAEWLQPANEAGELAPVAGGSYLDASAALQNLKIVQTEKRERARHIGLRVVVETGAN